MEEVEQVSSLIGDIYDAALELADLQADCRLREVELARCCGEAAELDHLEESPQLIEVEAAHLKEFLIDEI